MEILKWDDRFSVGNEEINYQHKMLFDFTNNLISSLGRSYGQNEIEEILEDLIAYTEYHFTFEEELLKNHPSIVGHRKIHAEFVAKVHHFEAEFKKGKVEISSDLFSFLVSWIKNHVLDTDVVFFKELNEKHKLSG